MCRELTEMLNRMNKGAQKVGDISGTSSEDLIFRGGIMFCLKDVQRDGMRSSVTEFNSRMRGFVQSGQNFVASIYRNNVAVGAFPPLSRQFFKLLQQVRGFLHQTYLLLIRLRMLLAISNKRNEGKFFGF